ncbi:MAG: cysteine--tRNA ligase [Nitrososphaeraceae archaeon]
MRIYNTFTRDFVDLVPSNGNIKIYVCGVTVYDDSHIGHARTIVVFDVLHRYLKFKGYTVEFLQNFTDIDDKIINRSRELGLSPISLAEKYIQKYFTDFSRLNLLSDIVYPKATDNISHMIDLISKLIKEGFAYITLNGVYFEVKSFSEYGKLSRKTHESLNSGARIEIDPNKKDPLDFALWKFYSENPVWDSPWGKGRPGWHIECSAMALKYLGKTIDIHGGGSDLIFPHHENEIAQSEAVTKEKFAKIWMHCGMVNINSEKMSKSLGNIITIENAINQWGPNTIRLFCLSIQYSKPLDYFESNLVEILNKWKLIEHCYYELKFSPVTIEDKKNVYDLEEQANKTLEKIKTHLEDDLNTSMALSEFMKFVAEINDKSSKEEITKEISKVILEVFNQMMYLFGLKIVEPSTSEIKLIENYIKERNKFRLERNYKAADGIRARLKKELNIELIDHANNRTIWKKTEK